MRRSYQREYIDLGSYTPIEYRDCLHKLGRIGRLLGGDRATLKAFAPFAPCSILDIGCGGGFLTKKLALRYPQAKVVGWDMNPEAVDFACEFCSGPANLTFSHQEPEGSFDLVTCCLVCHHISDDQLVAFIKNAYSTAGKAVVINDLHRSCLAWLSFAILSPVLFKNRLIQHDGLLSIRRSFVKSDWKRLMERAGISRYSIRWRWPFRWVVVIEK